VRVTHHAILRYREQHPDAENADLVAELERSAEIDGGVVNALCGRCRRYISGSYYLTPDRQGIFVLDADCVVTYLRLGPSQQKFCRREYGPGEGAPLPETVHGGDPRGDTFRLVLGHYLWDKWIEVVPKYGGQMTGTEREAVRWAFIEGPVVRQRGIVRVKVGEREAVAFEFRAGHVKIQWVSDFDGRFD